MKRRMRKRRAARWTALLRKRYRRELDRHDWSAFAGNRTIALAGPQQAGVEGLHV